MTTTMPTTAWDDTMPDEADVNAMELEHKARRVQMSRWRPARVQFWYLDRTFFKGVRKGRTLTDAREQAISGWGFVLGTLVGIAATVLFFAVASYFWTAAATGNWTNIVLNSAFLTLCVLLGLGYGHRVVKWLWRKVRRQES